MRGSQRVLRWGAIRSDVRCCEIPGRPWYVPDMADVSPYTSYEGFLRAAIKTYWESGRGSRLNFLSLLLACKEAWQAAWDRASTPGSGKSILRGAAGAAAIGILLRVFVGGPLGILLTGASIAGLVALYTKNHREILKRADAYRELVKAYRPRYDQVWRQHHAGEVDKAQFELMVDGLMQRFLADVDARAKQVSAAEGAAKAKPEVESFQKHAERKRHEAGEG